MYKRQSQIIGAKGGWREVAPLTAGPNSATASVLIKTAEEAWNAFLTNPAIALALPPQALIYDPTGKPAPTLAYYEQSLSITQTQLIPAWVFVADLYTETVGAPVQLQATAVISALVASDVNIYVPAAVDPAALPQATIDSPAPGTIIRIGQSVELAGSIVGGQAPYSYLWTSSVDGALGDTMALTSPALHPDDDKGPLTTNKITLLVIDSNGMSSAANVAVLVLTAVYLPLVIR